MSQNLLPLSCGIFFLEKCGTTSNTAKDALFVIYADINNTLKGRTKEIMHK